MLHLRKIILLCCLFLVCYSANANDDVRLKALINDYFSLIQSYSYIVAGKTPVHYKTEIFQLFDETAISGYDYASDLFNNDDQNGLSLNLYLTHIEKRYENKIAVQFDNAHYFNCTAHIEGKKFAFISVEKTLEYIGDKHIETSRKKTVKLLIGVDVTSNIYKINMVTFLESYISPDPSCRIDIKQDRRDVFFAENISVADAMLKKGSYVTALNFYEKALKLRPGDKSTIRKIEQCNAYVTYDNFKAEVETAITQKRYSLARAALKKIENKFPDKQDYVDRKYKECLSGEKKQEYLQYRKAGDEYYKKGFNESAKKMYEFALKYYPADNYCLGMLKKCRYASPEKIRKEISKAVYLAEEKRELVEAFKILSYYEGSGYLNGQNYYFMAMMMAGRDKKVHKYMGYTKKQCDDLAMEYCVKAIKKGDKNAKEMWQYMFTSRSLK